MHNNKMYVCVLGGGGVVLCLGMRASACSSDFLFCLPSFDVIEVASSDRGCIEQTCKHRCSKAACLTTTANTQEKTQEGLCNGGASSMVLPQPQLMLFMRHKLQG
jgi:hypothetical protein